MWVDMIEDDLLAAEGRWETNCDAMIDQEWTVFRFNMFNVTLDEDE